MRERERMPRLEDREQRTDKRKRESRERVQREREKECRERERMQRGGERENAYLFSLVYFNHLYIVTTLYIYSIYI